MTISVKPHEDGSWEVSDGENSSDYPDRRSAIAGAHEVRGDAQVEVVNKATNEVVREEYERGGDDNIVLLKLDGSVSGELSHATGNGGEPQRVDLEPAGETGEAGL